MIRDFSKEELAPVGTSSDTEFTLGAGTLFLLVGALVMLCAVCFGLGYAAGHRGSSAPVAAALTTDPTSKSATTPTGSGVKPGAGGAGIAQAQEPATVDQSKQAGEVAAAASTAPAIGSPDSSQSQVKPALDAQVRPALGAVPGQPASVLRVQPATTQEQGWMVQIAAVSHLEDAQVLVDALRKHGYEATARRDAGDNMIHVQTGPFVNRNDANAMRQKLLNDGYNAIVQ